VFDTFMTFYALGRNLFSIDQTLSLFVEKMYPGLLPGLETGNVVFGVATRGTRKHTQKMEKQGITPQYLRDEQGLASQIGRELDSAGYVRGEDCLEFAGSRWQTVARVYDHPSGKSIRLLFDEPNFPPLMLIRSPRKGAMTNPYASPDEWYRPDSLVDELFTPKETLDDRTRMVTMSTLVIPPYSIPTSLRAAYRNFISENDGNPAEIAYRIRDSHFCTAHPGSDVARRYLSLADMLK